VWSLTAFVPVEAAPGPESLVAHLAAHDGKAEVLIEVVDEVSSPLAARLATRDWALDPRTVCQPRQEGADPLVGVLALGSMQDQTYDLVFYRHRELADGQSGSGLGH